MKSQSNFALESQVASRSIWQQLENHQTKPHHFLVGKWLEICLCDTAGIATDRPLVYGKRQGITQSRWPNYCDHSVTSADVRLSAGPNLSRAACPRPVDLARPRRGLVTHQNTTPLRWIVDTLTPCLKNAR